jgi:DNA-binding SARP family transcriptional activator
LRVLFRVLGPVDVVRSGEAVPITGERQRAVLAMLLLSRNEVVSTERLIDAVWGADPPASAAHGVEVAVSNLRRQLARDVVLTRPPGYLVPLRAGDLDADLFTALVAEAGGARARGDPAAAAATLREALALWRGGALADVAAAPFALLETMRLEELRLAALEQRIDADLERGLAAEVVGELRLLIEAEPLRERLRELLMLALYGCGRQVEALEVFRDARQTLVDNVGIEPGPALRRAEQAILRQDADLARGGARRRDGEPSAAPAEVEERRVVSALVLRLPDAAGDPELRRREQERALEQIAEEIAVAGGALESVFGATVLASFGAREADEQHTARALEVALRLQAEPGTAGALRAGIDVGEALVEQTRVGGGSLSGDAIEHARRLADVAEPGEIVASARALAACTGISGCTAEPVEDRDLPVAALRLRAGERAAGGEPSLYRTRFVGRAAELDMLGSTYQRVAELGGTHVVTLIGEPGVGKSRLLYELTRRLAANSAPPALHRGRCAPHGRGVTYRPLAEILRARLGIDERDSPDRVREALRSREILGLTLGLEPPEGLHPVAAREQLHRAWVELAAELPYGGRPAVLVIEDVHWAEEPLLDLLEDIAREVPRGLLIVCAARPELLELRPAWGAGRRDYLTIWLESLAREDASAMAHELLGEELAELAPLVVEHSEGNPFFLEELVSTLVDEVAGAPLAELAASPRLPLPDSVRSVLAARMHALSPSERAGLQAASVIGRTFPTDAVLALLQGVVPSFAALSERDFLRASAAARPRELSFKHALTREVAYASLPRARRARLHAAFADWLERDGRGRDEDAPLLAHHYSAAVRPDDVELAWHGEPREAERLRRAALLWLRRAADLAVGRMALDDGLALLDVALSLEHEPAGRSALLRASGRAHALRYDVMEMWHVLEEAVGLAPDAADVAEIFSELAFETVNRYGMLDPMPSRELVHGWIDRALALAAPGSAARARALVARSMWFPADPEPPALEAVAIAETLPDVELRSHAWNAAACAAYIGRRYDESSGWAARRIAVVSQISDPDHLVDIYSSGIPGALGLGQIARARDFAQQHEQAASALSEHHQLHAVTYLVEIEELLGGWLAIQALTDRTEAAVAMNVNQPCIRKARALLTCAAGAAWRGDAAEAVRLEEEASEVEHAAFENVLAPPRIQIALARGDCAALEQLIDRAVAVPPAKNWWALNAFAARLDAFVALEREAAIEQEAPPLAVPGTLVEPFALRALAFARRDAELLERAVASFAELGLDWHAERSRALAVS